MSMVTGGQMRLGALIGANQSFETGSGNATPGIPNSWTGVITTCSLIYLEGTNTHSSAAALEVKIFSNNLALTILRYPFTDFGQVALAALPGLPSHPVDMSVWATRTNHQNFPGSVFLWLDDGTIQTQTPNIPTTSPFQRYNAPTLVSSFAVNSLMVALRTNAMPTTSSLDVMLDDVLCRIDEVVLNPTWDLDYQQEIIAADFPTQGGRLYTSIWAQRFRASVPLQYLGNSMADLFNYWFLTRQPLHLWLDSSDSESSRIVRIVNQTQPISKRHAPYQNLWQGTLLLEGITPGDLIY